MENLIKFLLKPRKFLSGNDADDFITLRTQITDAEVLINALQELGFLVKIDSEVRGYYTAEQANIVAVLKGDGDIGWIENINNNDRTFDLIVDLWCVGKYHNPESLIASINQKYHELKAIKDSLS